MHFLLGILRVESCDYMGAIRSFEHAQVQTQPHTSRVLVVVSLVSFPTAILWRIEITCDLGQMTGWKFDGFGITIRRHLCEALYAAGRAKQAGESLLGMIRLFSKEVYVSKDITQWVSGSSYLSAYCHVLGLFP